MKEEKETGLTAADKGRLRLVAFALSSRNTANQILMNVAIIESLASKGSDEEVIHAMTALRKADVDFPEVREDMN